MPPHPPMTIASLVALFATLALLAAVPSLSVLTVTSRALARGTGQGVLVAAGIVVGDVFYIALALFGGAAVLAAGGPWADVLRMAGAAALGVLAWRQWRSAGRPVAHAATATAALSSFAAGLAVTLADAKAVLFYLVLLPAFLDIGALGAGGVALVVAVAAVAVGGVKLGYALAAVRLKAWIGSGRARIVERAAACALGVAAVVLLSGSARI